MVRQRICAEHNIERHPLTLTKLSSDLRSLSARPASGSGT